MINITAIGDSNTDAVGRCSVTNTTQWTYRLLLRLGEESVSISDWTEFSANATIKNTLLTGAAHRLYKAGISGNTTAQMLARFDNDVLGHDTDILIINGGVNDVYYDTAASVITSNIAGMVAAANAAGIYTVVGTVTPRGSGTAPQKATINEVNEWIRANSSVLGYQCADNYSVVEDPANLGSPLSALSCDGLHYNALGNQTLADNYDIAAWPQEGDLDIIFDEITEDGDLDIIFDEIAENVVVDAAASVDVAAAVGSNAVKVVSRTASVSSAATASAANKQHIIEAVASVVLYANVIASRASSKYVGRVVAKSTQVRDEVKPRTKQKRVINR